MAGWDFPFDVDPNDEALARNCFRVLRRACGRHYITFTYYEDREFRREDRLRFWLVFNGRPHQLGLASADFALEMKAVSLVQSQRRHKRLPLRLLADVTYSGSDEPIRLQPTSDRVPESRRDRVAKHLEEYALAWGAWSRAHLPPAEFLEAQHSLLTNLALDLVPEATTKMSYPTLIELLRVPEYWEDECLQLGSERNRVKHRNRRHEAARYAESHVQCVYSVAHSLTGIDTMPRTVYMQAWERDPATAFRALPTFDRFGTPKRYSRY